MCACVYMNRINNSVYDPACVCVHEVTGQVSGFRENCPDIYIVQSNVLYYLVWIKNYTARMHKAVLR